jgi:mannose-6-phosphate isomerase-like protein (cupin superfamily)
MANIQSPRVRVIDSAVGCPEIPMVEGEGNAKLVLSRHNGASFRSFQLVSLAGGARTIELSHSSDCAYYVIEGEGAIIDATSLARFDLSEGHMVHIDAGDRYRIESGTAGMKVIGGPCPPDEALYANVTSGKG